MKILFISSFFFPHIGGVEKHVYELSKNLRSKGEEVTVITEKFDQKLKNKEDVGGINVVRILYPHTRFLGLFLIWFEIFKNRKLIIDADIVHIHDVFIWYLPFRVFYPNKKVFTTFHGWEGVWPIPWGNIIQKRIAAKLSTGTIAVGKYIEKYYGIKADKIMYGGN